MRGWPDPPVLYEVNTWAWLQGLTDEEGRRVTLADVPPSAWEAVTPEGIDALWLMGVWERSPAGLAIARTDDRVVASCTAALGELGSGDLVGSPYCVRRYVVDEQLGGPAGLATARRELARRGVRLVLDYVPNHVAPDHPWVLEHPDRFVRGAPEEVATAPGSFLEAGGRVLAHGRDPFFPPWPDVVQLNAFAEGLRRASAEVLESIGDQCDGVRCDMAMLVTNDVFARTWGERAGPVPAEELWPAVLGRVRRRHPDMVFIAEAYWDLEWELQQQGFDFCYDKRLYDRLVAGDAEAVRQHLAADLAYQERLCRFIENHDEPRAAAAFAPGQARAAAVTIATLPGATLWHDGQFEGRSVHLPVFLGRAPKEPVDEELRSFYRGLVTAASSRGLRRGDWTLLEATGWADNSTCRNLLAWSWSGGEPSHVVVVNLSATAAQGRVRLPWADLAGRRARLEDLLSGATYLREGEELAGPGLFVDLPPWGHHVVSVRTP